MKKIVIFSIAIMTLASCLGSSSFESTYPLVVDFEFNQVDNDKVFGSDGVYYDNKLGIGDIVLNCAKAGTEYNGFAWSMASNKNENKYEDRFTVYDTTAADKSKGFAVFHKNPSIKLEHDIIFLQSKNGTFNPISCMVHNTKQVAKEILEDGISKFERGDSLKLTATGYLNGVPTGEAEIMLADFRQKDSLITRWTEFKLDKLGNVEYIDFSFTSSKPLPKYFCMDNLLGKVSISIK